MADDDPIRQEDLDNLPTVRGLGAGQVLFGRYVLESKLGAGGMGVVWRAKDAELDEPVALKFLPEIVACDDEAVDELKAETRYARQLTHANIVRIHQFEHAGSIAAISMELVDGMTLKKLQLAQPGKVFAISTLAPLVAQLCAALDYAHGQAKIIHRDIKPANILVTRDDVVKVTDFGIARSLADSSTRLTGKGGGASGTILYMSPQQVCGFKPKGTDDLYSLGAMLYELLTGKPPFFRGDLLSMRMQILKNTPLPLAVQRAQLQIEGDPIPSAWSETILACLAKESEGRPQSAGEVAQRLGIKRVSRKGRPAEDEAPLRDARGRRRIVFVAALTAIGLCILAYAFWSRLRGKPQLASRPDDAAGGQAALAHTVTAPAETAQTGREEAPAIHDEKVTPKPSISSSPATPASEAAREMASAASPDVQARYDHARELARQGKNVKALAEYLWCFDDGMRQSRQFAELRLNSLLSSVAKLGQNYPPALQALRQRRDAAKTHVLEDTNDTSSLVDMVALNHQLGEAAANLAFYDQLPAESRARALLGGYVFDQLIEAHRYPEAAAAQPFDQFKRMFDPIIKHFEAHPERKRGMSHYVAQSGGRELEALAGAGDLAHARELLQILLKADGSQATLSVLRDHLERAGHGELLAGMAHGSSP
jgi:hypothetical protein